MNFEPRVLVRAVSRQHLLLTAVAVSLLACGSGDGANPADSATLTPGTPGPTASNGAQLYQRCVTCHMADGNGSPGVFPPLANSEYAAAANVEVPIRILMHGMEGPITVKGVEYNGAMPPYGIGIEMSDEDVASLLTYVRSSFGNSASEITAADVARVRAAPRAATGPVTAAELKTMM